MTLKIFVAAIYVLVIVIANWSIQKWGIVSVGFGLMAPAGVYFAGLAFSIRDALQEVSDKYWIIGAIVVGAIVSYAIEDGGKIAIASGSAFFLSELADFAVYSPLRYRGKIRALFASNVVGLVADSILFLYLAFGSLEFLSGQVVAKAYMTGGVIIIMLAYRLFVKRI
ncbi:MAG: VUT family protein [Chloroflexota bacterium]|nr:VUT family protein [Chloroflexota bacterium]